MVRALATAPACVAALTAAGRRRSLHARPQAFPRHDAHDITEMASDLFTLADIESALPIVRSAVPPTPQYAWPQLAARTGAEVFVKHENHTPTGAFKVRGGLVYLDRLRREQPQATGIVSATRGNHGQSLAFAARRAGVAAAIVVPRGNSVEKNAAMRAFGAELIEHGRDFDEAKEHAATVASQRGYAFAPSFHRDLVVGVATYAYEFFKAVSDLDTVYVPIGLGSGICGVIGVRDALGLSTRIVGVVSQHANAYGRSFAAGKVVTTETAHTFADGLAVRVPDPAALAVIRGGADRIVEVSEEGLVEAIGIYFSDTHTVAEGAGAAPLAALLKERDRMQGRRVGLVLSGQNIDRAVMGEVLAGHVPGGRPA
jgi:threonine dehydratase